MKGIGLEWHRIWSALALVYFTFRLACYAVWFHPFVPPDEVDLFSRVELFRSTLGIPADTPASAVLGVVRHAPFAYFWLMARVTSLGSFGMPPLVFARLVNAALGVAAAVVALRLSKTFLQSAHQRVLALVVLTNTLEFSTLSATVTYDNLANLLTYASLALLFDLAREFQARRFLLLVVLQALNALTKISQLPLIALIALVLVLMRRGSWRSDLRALASSLRAGTPSLVALAVLAAALAVGGTLFYASNLLRFGGVFPTPLQVHPPEVALENRIFRRDWTVDRFRAGELTFEQAVAELEKIPNRGNRKRGLQMLYVAANPSVSEARRVSFPSYLGNWLRIMGDRILGFQGNGSFVVAPGPALRGVALLSMLGAILGWRLAKADDEVRARYRWAGVIVLGYAAFLILAITYPLYRRYGILDNTVNGRYLFPVLPVVYCFLIRFSLGALPARAQIWCASGLAAIFLAGDLPHLLPRMGPCWFRDAPAALACPY